MTFVAVHNLTCGWLLCVIMDASGCCMPLCLCSDPHCHFQSVGDRWLLEPLAQLLACDVHVLRCLLANYEVEVDDERMEARDGAKKCE